MTNPYPVAGDIIVSDADTIHFIGMGKRKDIPAGTPLTVVYSEDPRHGTNSHNVDFYHPDWGKRSLVIDIKKWRILGK
jgi:hypothetical protein